METGSGVIQYDRQIDLSHLAHDYLLTELDLALATSWSQETSYDPDAWSIRNAPWGQCAVTALVVQDFFGGQIVTGEVNGMEHYWNQFPDGQELDLTAHQFGAIVSRLNTTETDRTFILSNPDTARRYELLRAKVGKALKNLHSRD